MGKEVVSLDLVVAHSHSNRILVTKYCCEKIIRHTQLPKTGQQSIMMT